MEKNISKLIGKLQI